MSIRALVACVAVLASLVVTPQRTDGAACVTACHDEIAACVATDCQGLTHRPLRRCKRQCKKAIVHDCFADLTVCGATVARPPKPSGGGGGGGASSGGW
jgi:hypothetical protein